MDGREKYFEELIRQLQAIADPRLGEQILRLVRLALNLIPQSIDENAQVFFLVAGSRAPHFL